MTAPDATTAVVRRVLPAPPEVVYAHWLDPAALATFICPYPSRCGTVECEPWIGGRLRIDMVGPETVVLVTGEYLDLRPPHRLRFTWDSALGGGFHSMVTVTLAAHGPGQTMMTIEHTKLPPDWRDDHEHGWGTIAGNLDQLLRTAGTAGG